MDLLVMGTVAFDVVGNVPHLPEKNATVRLFDICETPGGAAANVGIVLARLGLRPSLVGVVGEDFPGSVGERTLLDTGVDLSRVARAPGLTARAFMFSDPDGSQHIYFHPGASRRSERLGPPEPSRIGHFAAGDVTAYPPFMRTCGLVGFDPGQEVFHRDLKEIERCFPLTDHLYLNEFELAHLHRERGWSVDRLLDAGVGCVVESRGAKGSTVHRPGSATEVPAVPSRLVDPTGAGDAHRAGITAALASGAEFDDAVRLGAVVASFVVEAHGTQEGAPTREAAAARYRKAFGEPFPLPD